jgi:purine-binding chemotaxis protein CheW
MSDVKSILRSRARALAQPPARSSGDEESLELLEFRLAKERYALETRYVSEVYPLKNLTPLPSTPAFVAGVVNVRGRIVAVLDLKKFFTLPEGGLTDLHRIILISGHDMEFGLLADLSVGVLTIAMSSVQRALPTLTGIGADYLKGVTADRLIVLDMERILTDPRIIVHEEVGN